MQDFTGKSIVVFSDLHLSYRFDTSLFGFLSSLINKNDVVIVNGDLWDYCFTSYERFINSKWRALLKQMGGKISIYLEGNHDPFSSVDEELDQFIKMRANKFRLKSGQKIFNIEHGNKIYPGLSQLHKVPKIKYLEYPANWIDKHIIRRSLVKLFGIEGSKTLILPQLTNNKMSRMSRKEGEISIFGHSHVPQVDLENNFINCGFINYGLASYVVIKDGEVDLKISRY
ncbi:MAG: metallophosphoesterase [Candidatus Dojkabacteria bacterium]|nr:metallophosphoesterase [Candidatus Dojkabacteria bacterium]